MRPTRLAAFLILAACTQFPQLDAVEGAEVEAAAYPRLLTVGELRMVPASRTDIALQETVHSRVAALQARAARLRGPVIDRATRARMARGVRGAR